MSSNTLTYQQVPSRRPGIQDVGGGAKENHPKYPPDPVTMPTAEDANQIAKQIVAMAPFLPVLAIQIGFPGGVPTKLAVYSVNPDLNFVSEIQVTDNGLGDTTVTVTAPSKLPSATWPPFAMQIDDTEIDRMRTIATANGARVKTKLGATGTDASFLLFMSGV